ncbi:C6 transcription factor-like protein [Stemphylium lycopersici]|nr:C6 transcription factor-like protein [Stemphylium lycopersici]
MSSQKGVWWIIRATCPKQPSPVVASCKSNEKGFVRFAISNPQDHRYKSRSYIAQAPGTSAISSFTGERTGHTARTKYRPVQDVVREKSVVTSTFPGNHVYLAERDVSNASTLKVRTPTPQRKKAQTEGPQKGGDIASLMKGLLDIAQYQFCTRIGCGREQLEIVEQIMGPFKREVVELYFSHIHYHFPILDDEMCETLRTGQYAKVPNNLMCVIYALASPHWPKSDTLKMHPKPNSYYVWNKGISATLEDFLSPGMSTIQAAVLDQVGRPSVSIIGNITLCGRTVSLAQTFGLHRDPSKWSLTENEKSVRIRLWWCVLITDQWSSVAYGAPPYVSKGYYDVPRPTVTSLIGSRATPQQKQATTCFVHLCGLTELLAEILPFVYQINPDRVQLAREIDRFKLELNDLETQLPEWLPLPNRPGTPMLWLSFLSIRLVLARVIFRAAVLDGDGSIKRSRMDQLRIASSAVLDFILTMGETQFFDFWLPYATHLLVHAITVSLRCTVETQDSETRNSSVSRLERVIAHIQHARDNYDWDIANYCLERCADPVSKIASLNAREAPQPSETEYTSVVANGNGGEIQAIPNFDDASFLLSDILDPNAFDFSWDALWDTPSGMTNFSI